MLPFYPSEGRAPAGEALCDLYAECASLPGALFGTLQCLSYKVVSKACWATFTHRLAPSTSQDCVRERAQGVLLCSVAGWQAPTTVTADRAPSLRWRQTRHCARVPERNTCGALCDYTALWPDERLLIALFPCFVSSRQCGYQQALLPLPSPICRWHTAARHTPRSVGQALLSAYSGL